MSNMTIELHFNYESITKCGTLLMSFRDFAKLCVGTCRRYLLLVRHTSNSVPGACSLAPAGNLNDTTLLKPIIPRLTMIMNRGPQKLVGGKADPSRSKHHSQFEVVIQNRSL